MQKAICEKPDCTFSDVFEPDDFGISYFQAIGKCPWCGGDTYCEDGTLTRKLVILEV